MVNKDFQIAAGQLGQKESTFSYCLPCIFGEYKLLLFLSVLFEFIMVTCHHQHDIINAVADYLTYPINKYSTMKMAEKFLFPLYI